MACISGVQAEAAGCFVAGGPSVESSVNKTCDNLDGTGKIAMDEAVSQYGSFEG